MSYAFARTLPELVRDLRIHPTEYDHFVQRLLQQIEVGEAEVVVLTTHGWKVPAVILPGAVPWKRNDQ